MRQNRWELYRQKGILTKKRIQRNPVRRRQEATLARIDELFEEIRDLRLQVGEWIVDSMYLGDGVDSQKEAE